MGGDELASDLHAQGLGHKAESVSYQLLCDGLDDLEARGLLRPGVRGGLDVVIWTTVHGFSSLVLDGLAADRGARRPAGFDRAIDDGRRTRES